MIIGRGDLVRRQRHELLKALCRVAAASAAFALAAVVQPMELLASAARRPLAEAGFNGEAFIDSTPLPVCAIQRERDRKCFKANASKGCGSFGWFYGLNLHLIALAATKAREISRD